MTSAEIRRLFLDFFSARGHREVPSSSLVPSDDPTLLFTNAGMVQFKRVFLGQERRNYDRAVTCQKCVRAGGKHNDLEQVGHTSRHHTFFEMLGNFSFGDYFKREAIAYAWEFVTGSSNLNLDPERLRVTVHHSDHKARALWRELAGLPEHRIYGLGDTDNFWQMADTGPCGPCTEIYVDLGAADGQMGGWADVVPQPEFERLAEEGRFLEIWNLVFMQYDRAADGTLTPLPRPSVDTGAGLERIAAVLQGKGSNFHTDLFRPLIEKAQGLLNLNYHGEHPEPEWKAQDVSFRVLADHARSVAFLLADGVYPSNEGRGYVLRRILRRAVRHAWLLGRRQPTLAPLTEVVVREMGEVYPELAAKAGYILDVTRQEEERFLDTIEGGLKRLEEIVTSGSRIISGEDAFKLYDTFGFPVDLTQIIAGERGLSVDIAGFENALEQQRQRSRDARVVPKGVSTHGRVGAPAVHVSKPGAWRTIKRGKQKFVGYEADAVSTGVLAFRQEGPRVDVLLRKNPFYAESGGQVSDTGEVIGTGWSLAVDSVHKEQRGTVVAGEFADAFEASPVEARIAAARRRDIERNHSVTHLAHYVLRQVLGTHVRQQGSLVEPARMRFDFSHHGPLDPRTLDTIEREVNALVWENFPVTTEEMAYQDALGLGAMAFFSEKYGDRVRVVRMGPSIELCGGTHVRSTGQIGLVRLVGQGGVAAGVRRIEVVTGPEAYVSVEQLKTQLQRVSDTLRSQPEHVVKKVEQLVEERSRLEARLAAQAKSAPAFDQARATTRHLDGVLLIMEDVPEEERGAISLKVDAFRNGRSHGVYVLFESTRLHVAITDDLIRSGKKAGDLVNRIAAVSGGKGGGRPQFASAGAGDPERLGAAREATPELVAAWLEGG